MSTNRNNNPSNIGMYATIYNFVKKDKTDFVKELKAKGHKLTGKESAKKITELILNIK